MIEIELEVIDEEKNYFTPNEMADYRLTLKNKLGSAWIRVKFDLSGKNIGQEFTDKDLQIQDGWIKRGGYFYYAKKAEVYTDYLVVDGIGISDVAVTDKQSREERANVTISVYGEAIQYNSITPNFSSEIPWNKEEPRYTAHISGASHRGTTPMDSIYLYSSPQETGTSSKDNWELINQENHIWKYWENNGNYAKDGWFYIFKPYSQEEEHSWFHFDENGVMTYGWHKAKERI